MTDNFYLGSVNIEVGSDWVSTFVDPGADICVSGVPEDTPDYRATAERLGYGDDTVKLNRDHEITHSLLAHWLGLPCSPTLLHVAQGHKESTVTTGLEEDAVMAIQRFATRMGVDILSRLKAATKIND